MPDNIDRKKIINEIVSDLRSLKDSGQFKDAYPIDENIKFFEAIRNLWSYLRWLITDMRKVDPERILELSDFNIAKWQLSLQEELSMMERWKLPDILGPLKKEIISQITDLSEEKSGPLILLNIGCGASELERRLIVELGKGDIENKIIWFCADNSRVSLELGQKKLNEIGIEAIIINGLSNDALERIKAAPAGKVSVYLVEGDVKDLGLIFPEKSVDLVYYSKFIHHLPKKNKELFVANLIKIADRVVEWDDYNGLYLLLLPPIINWKYPVLLNGAVFSSLRDYKKQEVLDSVSNLENWRAEIFPLTGYKKVYNAGGFKKRK